MLLSTVSSAGLWICTAVCIICWADIEIFGPMASWVLVDCIFLAVFFAAAAATAEGVWFIGDLLLVEDVWLFCEPEFLRSRRESDLPLSLGIWFLVLWG